MQLCLPCHFGVTVPSRLQGRGGVRSLPGCPCGEDGAPDFTYVFPDVPDGLVTVFRQVNKVLYLRRDGLPWKGERPPQGCWSFAYSHKSCPAGLLPLPAELITRTSPTANKPCRSPKVGTHPAIPPGTGSVSCQRVTHFSSCCQVRSALSQPRGFEPCPCPKKW